jgi:hypothetical protein
MAITKIQSESLNLADDFAFTGTITGAGGNMKPMFQARLTASQNTSINTFEKIQFNYEEFDADGVFDNSTNYRFTIPSGQAGKYYIYSVVTVNSLEANKNVRVDIYKNGVSTGFFRNGSPIAGTTISGNYAIMDDASVGDYYEVFIYQNSGTQAVTSGAGSRFGAFKIIE